MLKVYIATLHSGGCIPWSIQASWSFISVVFRTNSHISNTKLKACYTRMFQKLSLSGGNFYNVFVRGIC